MGRGSPAFVLASSLYALIAMAWKFIRALRGPNA
jgi:hypothetical protein